MKAKHKRYIKLNIMSLLFIFVSFISVTLAWFAYSGLSETNLEVGVKAWYIEFQKDNKAIDNNVIVSVDNIYPGMDTVNETVDVANLGDSDAIVNYSIVSARILNIDNYNIGDDITSEYVEDKLSQSYPFHININLNRGFVLAKGEKSKFDVSISWPLDGVDNKIDSKWGNDAYNYKKDNPSEASIKLVLSLKAEQYVDDDSTIDANYYFGKEVLYDINTNKKCNQESSTCIKTHVIEDNSKIGDKTIKLLPPLNITNNYSNLTTEDLSINDVIKIVSHDINNTYIVHEGISDRVLGSMKNDISLNNVINSLKTNNETIKYSNTTYNYLTSNECIWISDESETNGFALKNIDEKSSEIYNEIIDTGCKVVPIILGLK